MRSRPSAIIAPYQFDNGKVPCCVDDRGSDPVPENDSHGEQTFGDHCAVADPAARVRARARLQARADARDQLMRERGAQGVDQRLAFDRHIDTHRIERTPPALGNTVLPLFCGASIAVAAGRAGHRNRQRDFARFARLQTHAVGHRAGRETGRISHGGGRWPCCSREMRCRHPAIEGRGERDVRRTFRVHAFAASDADDCAVDGERFDPADAAGGVEKLARWIDLERLHRQRQCVIANDRSGVAHNVACDQLRTLRRAVGECRDPQLRRVMRPVDAGNRQIAVLQRLRDRRVRPAQQLAIDDHERFDAETALPHFDRAVFADQPLLGAAVDAEDRPVRLLAAETAWKQPTRRLLRDRRHEIVRMRGEGQRLDPHFAQGIARTRTIAQFDREMSRFRFRQRDPVATSIAARDHAQFAPMSAIVGHLHGIIGGLRGFGPVEAQPAEFGVAAQIEGQPLDAFAGMPSGAGIAVDRPLRFAARRGCGCAHDLGQGAILRQRREGQCIETDFTFAACAVVDGELELGAAAQLRIRARPPGLADMPAFVAHRCPLMRIDILRSIHPPDVVATGIDQFELQIVGGRFAAQPEIEAVIVGVLDVEIALDADVTGDAVEVVVEAEPAAFGADAAADLGRGDDAPGSCVVEGIQKNSGILCLRAAKRHRQTDHDAVSKQNHVG
jgi:hypothetical protein